MSIYIGIDPGKSGAYAALFEDGEVFSRPWDDSLFVKEMCGFADIARERSEPIVACVEKVGALPKQGVVSMFKFGKSAGFIEGVLQANGIPYQLVPPQTWKKEFSLNSDKKRSIETCKTLFPGVNMRRTERCTTDHDGIAEALLMALYAKRRF